MKKIIFYGIGALAVILFFSACKKPKLTGPENTLEFDRDTVKFDTLFTGDPKKIMLGSPTERLVVRNLSKKDIIIKSISLEKGTSSPFKMNIDGVPTNYFTDYHLRSGDSVHVFIELPRENNTAKDVFVRDNILFNLGDKTQSIPIELYSLDANFIYGDTPCSGLWTLTTGKPYVIVDSIVVPFGCTLTIDPQAEIYFYNNAVMLVDGTLIVNGGSMGNGVLFRGTRFHPCYENITRQWQGIYFRQTSSNNIIKYATIKNAIVGVRCDFRDQITPSNPKVKIQNTKIYNMASSGIVGFNTNMELTNVLIHNCFDYAAQMEGGGTYQFIYCTLANYGCDHDRDKQLVRMADYDALGTTDSLEAYFTNTIIYGSALKSQTNEEIEIDQKGTNFNYIFDHCLVKTDLDITGGGNPNSNIKNSDPQFNTTCIEFEENSCDIKTNIDFHVGTFSVCKKKATPISITDDIEGNSRGTCIPTSNECPTIGAYE